MKYIQGQNRTQINLFPISLEDAITPDNEIRLIDVFVDRLDLEKFGFAINHIENGRPAYHPSDLLKLYIYGYLNRIRSSRNLEKECKRNIEVMWLIKTLTPDHNTISNFRKNNPTAIKKVFRETVRIAKHFNLIGGVLLAGDSTKLRAQNSKKNNFNKKKIDRHLEYIENKLQEYEKALAEGDGDNKQDINGEIKKQNKRKENYKNLDKELDKTGQPQISSSDPDSRQMITRNNITEVAYNIQTTIDAKNHIPIDYKVTNTNDSKAMGNMIRRAKSILRKNDFTILYDKGYHTGSEFDIADRLGIETMVAIPKVAANSPNTDYNVENFTYCKVLDYYICPQGHKLTTTGKLHKAKTYTFKRYTTKKCMSCPVKPECSKARYGKAIQRSEFQENIEQNKTRIEQKQEIYKLRQSIAEHPYGTIKRQWGYDHVITKKTKKHASADVGLIMVAYNLRRLFNIIDKKQLKQYLDIVFSYFSAKYETYRFILSLFKLKIFYTKIWSFIFNNSLNRIYLNQIYELC